MYNLGKHNTTPSTSVVFNRQRNNKHPCLVKATTVYKRASDKNHQSAREQIKPTWLQLPSDGRYRQLLWCSLKIVEQAINEFCLFRHVISKHWPPPSYPVVNWTVQLYHTGQQTHQSANTKRLPLVFRVNLSRIPNIVPTYIPQLLTELS